MKNPLYKGTVDLKLRFSKWKFILKLVQSSTYTFARCEKSIGNFSRHVLVLFWTERARFTLFLLLVSMLLRIQPIKDYIPNSFICKWKIYPRTMIFVHLHTIIWLILFYTLTRNRLINSPLGNGNVNALSKPCPTENNWTRIIKNILERIIPSDKGPASFPKVFKVDWKRVKDNIKSISWE